MVSPEALAEFKRIWKNEYGTEITDAEALPKAVALLTLFDVIYRPITKEQAEKYGNDYHATLPRWLRGKI
jgi:hypothetical protein